MQNNRHNPELGSMFDQAMAKFSTVMVGTTPPLGDDRASLAVATQAGLPKMPPPKTKRNLSLEQAVAELGGKSQSPTDDLNTPSESVDALQDDVLTAEEKKAAVSAAGGNLPPEHGSQQPAHNAEIRTQVREALRDAGVLKSDKNLEAARVQHILTCIHEIGRAMGLQLPKPPDEEAQFAEQMELARQEALEAAQGAAAEAGKQPAGKPARPFNINGSPDLGALAIGGPKMASADAPTTTPAPSGTGTQAGGSGTGAATKSPAMPAPSSTTTFPPAVAAVSPPAPVPADTAQATLPQ